MSDPVILCKMEVVYMPVFRLPQTTFKPTKVCVPLSHHNHHRHHHHGHSNHTDRDDLYDRRHRNVDIDIFEYVVDEEEESSY